MTVSLIIYTENPEYVAGMAAATCTRSSNYEQSLKHAMAGGHESVLEHVVFTFKIEGVSRVLLAQLTRHRIASYSVESQRYCDMGYFPVTVPQSIYQNPDMKKAFYEHMNRTAELYREMVAAGIPMEDARYITPQAAWTNLVLTMNARELRHFFSLRCCNRAQWEIRKLADEMLKICKQKAPIIFQAAGPGCVRGQCPEERPCGHPRSSGK